MSRRSFRFAPSPNGYLHLGHALSALLNADMARQAGGRLLLRIEDIDAVRCRPEFEAAIYDDLAWLGLEWETPVRRQSEHIEEYRAALDRLDAMGLIYSSFESRGDIARLVASRGADWPCDPDGAPLYPGPCADLTRDERSARVTAGEPFALRLDMRAAMKLAGELTWHEEGTGPEGETGVIGARPNDWGDVVLARKDVPTSYHLSVVIDDAVQGISDVVRGHDLFWSTSVHRVLQALLDFPEPRYHHHRLIRDENDEKLSKSTSAAGLRNRRAQGATPAEVRRIVALSD